MITLHNIRGISFPGVFSFTVRPQNSPFKSITIHHGIAWLTHVNYHLKVRRLLFLCSQLYLKHNDIMYRCHIEDLLGTSYQNLKMTFISKIAVQFDAVEYNGDSYTCKKPCIESMLTNCNKSEASMVYTILELLYYIWYDSILPINVFPLQMGVQVCKFKPMNPLIWQHGNILQNICRYNITR